MTAPSPCFDTLFPADPVHPAFAGGDYAKALTQAFLAVDAAVKHEDYSTDWACAAQGSREEVEARDKAQVARMAEKRKRAADYEQAAQQREEELQAKEAEEFAAFFEEFYDSR